MHLGIKNRTLVIALEPWAVPEDLGVSPQGCWHRHGTSSQVSCIMDTLHCQKKPLTVLQTTCTPKHQHLHTESKARGVGLQEPLHWPQALMLGVVMPTGTALTGVG